MPDEARAPSVDVLMRARHQRWNWLGRILRMKERRLARQALQQCVKPRPESLRRFTRTGNPSSDKPSKGQSDGQQVHITFYPICILPICISVSDTLGIQLSIVRAQSSLVFRAHRRFLLWSMVLAFPRVLSIFLTRFRTGADCIRRLFRYQAPLDASLLRRFLVV